MEIKWLLAFVGGLDMLCYDCAQWLFVVVEFAIKNCEREEIIFNSYIVLRLMYVFEKIDS